MGNARVVVCGEALIDLVPAAGGGGYLARPGGSPANVAVGLGRLGVEVSLLTRLSSDYFGQLVREHLTASRVDLSLAAPTLDRTTVAMVTLSPPAGAGYTFGIEGGVDDGWRVGALPALPGSAALHVSGSLALAVPEFGDCVTALLDREHGHRVISLDPNPRPTLSPDVPALLATLESWLSRADLVKVSEEDLTWTCLGEEVADVAQRWRRLGPSLVVVTRGSDGVYALGPSGEVELAATSVELVDTVGAGDAFTAGLLAALDRAGQLDRHRLATLRVDELAAALRFAQRVAAVTCTRAGADPPWLAELSPE